MEKNEHGFTLIEVLSTLALLSLIILLASSVNLFGQKQVINQTKEIQNQANVRLALNIITKEIRSVSPQNITVSNNILTIETKKNTTNVYKLENSTLKKNGQAMISDIQKFDLSTTSDSITISITAQTTPPENLTTTIYYRK